MLDEDTTQPSEAIMQRHPILQNASAGFVGAIFVLVILHLLLS